MKIIYGFRGIIFELAVRLNNAPFRCNKLTALPERCLMGWTRRSGKKYTIVNALENGMGGDWMERNNGLGNEMELYWLFVCGYICAWITADKRNGMTGWICGVEWSSHLCRAVLRWEKWTERNVVKGGRVVRYEQRPPKRNERREWTDRKHIQIKHDIFFFDCNRWKGGGEFCWFLVGGRPKQLTD